MIGLTFGKLTAISELKERCSSGDVMWEFLCVCGNKIIRSGYSVRASKTYSCGCVKRGRAGQQVTHGMTNTKVYQVWGGMKNRCNNPKNRHYKDYGGRGITVSTSWDKFENFIRDMGDKAEGQSLDRIDNNKGYSKENCHWSSWSVQQNNRRNNKLIKYKGEIKTMAKWAEHFKINKSTFKSQIRKGWSISKILQRPVGRNKDIYRGIIKLNI